MEPLVSVIVPIYKVEEYLSRCLDSIVEQTYRNLEIILVDDGSPDNCGAICDRYAAQDSRIRVIHKENGGLSSARNAGLDIMTGDYVMFVDSDDWLSLDAVQVLYDRLAGDGSDMAIGQMVKMFEDGHAEDAYCAWMQDMILSGEQALSMLGTTQDIPCCAWGKLYDRRIFDELRFTHVCCAEDVLIFPHVLDVCQKISLIEQTIYFYYQRSTSIIHTVKDPQRLDNILALWHVASFFAERGMWKNASVYYRSGMLKTVGMKDVAPVRKLRRELFTGAERNHLMKQYWKNYFELSIIYFPNMYKILRGVKRSLGNKRGYTNGR